MHGKDDDFLKPFEALGTELEVRDEEAKTINLTAIATKQKRND